MAGMLVRMFALSTYIKPSVNQLLNKLFPPTCVFCATPMTDEAGCCPDCLSGIEIHPLACCQRCGAPLPSELAPGPCGRCLKKAPFQQSTSSLYIYKGPVRDALLAWKLHGEEAGIHWLVDAAASRLRQMISADDLLLPVPMPLSRMRKSGKHHSADLCRMIAAHTNSRFDWQLLRRIGEQPRQSSLSGSARRKNLCKAFALDRDYLAAHASVHGRIWIIDDILTTGATLGYAAKAMKPAKIPVHVLSLAHTYEGGK